MLPMPDLSVADRSVSVASHYPAREARLRPEFAQQYPGVEPNVWFTAATLAEHLLARMLREGKADLARIPRLLDPAHFEFRGGEGPSGSAPNPGRRKQD
jgi:hypothetical protein